MKYQYFKITKIATTGHSEGRVSQTRGSTEGTVWLTLKEHHSFVWTPLDPHLLHDCNIPIVFQFCADIFNIVI